MYLFIFRERGKGGRKRGREISVYGCFSRDPHWGPGLQPRSVPWPGIELVTPQFTVHAQSTEPHQPGLFDHFYFYFFSFIWNQLLFKLICFFNKIYNSNSCVLISLVQHQHQWQTFTYMRGSGRKVNMRYTWHSKSRVGQSTSGASEGHCRMRRRAGIE